MRLGETIWRDTADSAVLAALGPGTPSELDRRPDVLVVGGGIVGLATAAFCTRAGLGRVVLIERDRLAAGASGGAAALLTPEAHVWTDPPPFVELGRRSLRLLRALDNEWDGALGVEPLQWLVALPRAIPRDTDLGALVDVLDPDAARAAEPELGDVPGALRIREQGRVNPLHLAAALATRAGTVATGVEMLSTTASEGRVSAVHTTHGDFRPGAVVFATGLAPELGLDGLNVPQRWIKGHLLATEPAPFRLRAAIAAVEGLVLQVPGGEIIAGGTLDEGDDDPAVREDVIDLIRNSLAALLPRTADLAVQNAWCCFRPATADEQPVIDRLPGLDNAWVTCGHFRTGILMAAATGDALSRWIADGRRPDGIGDFGLARFGP
ncbi:MAG: FAD-binding oxidoreductase [Actinomycetota bacterium]|nr:FAD-binding oxidoreductase [Actinomycetota bacterium]